jgi:two-component system, chemotaxis family, chemotaxis protein CheY
MFHLLIVDDSPAMRKFIRRSVELSGFAVGRCLEAADGAEALAVLRQNHIHAVLTDINMPGMDGEQLIRRLADDRQLRQIPVMILSTDGTEKRMEQMLSLGARAYVRKPFQPETLRSALEELLEATA